MTNQMSPCDTQHIDSFLSDQLKPLKRNQFLAHLETCESCRTELERKAAEPEFWTEAADLLSTTFDTASSGEAVENESIDPRLNLSLRTIVDWLSPTDNPEMLGRIGEFEISGIVGIGGMGAVLKGFDASLLRVVAIKVMAPHLANNGSARARFEREARAAAAITHPNVIDIFRVDEKDGLPYLVMPFARGPSLQKRIDSDGPLSTLEVIQTGRQIASGLAAAHEQGLVHRDIKPANILLSDGLERLVITDFGVARAMDDVSMTQTGLIAGTPQYMSPEQARGELVDHRSDQFSLGAVLYTACTGRPPFRAEAPFAVLRKVTEADPRPIREINTEVPVWLESLIHRLLSKHPTDRFEDAEEVAQLLEQCLAHLRQPTQIELPKTIAGLKPATASKPKSAPTKTRSFFSRTGVTVSLLGIFSAALAALTLFFSGAPDISGTWRGEVWQQVELASVVEAKGWYTGHFVDAAGNRGAIHLEWSPISRRFDGRWSIGRRESGTIVLRPGQASSVRGAILMDSDSEASDLSRLRDFRWSKSSGELNYRIGKGEINAEETTRGTAIVSPASGVIEQIAKNIRNGKTVSKGQLILKIQPTDLRRRLMAAKDRRDAVAAKVEINKELIQDFRQTGEFAVKAAKGAAETAKAKYESEAAMAKGLEAKVDQAKSKLADSKKLFEKSYVSQDQVKKDETELAIANAALQSRMSTIAHLNKQWQLKAAEVAEKIAVSKVKVSAQEAKLKDAKSGLEQCNAVIETLKSQSSEVAVTAPFDGVISQWQEFKEGDSIDTSRFILSVLPIEFNQQNSDNAPASTALSSQVTQVIRTPTSGVITKVVDGLGDGSVVRKGKLILEIESSIATLFEIQLSERNATRTILENQIGLQKTTIAGLKEANAFALQASAELADAARAKFESTQSRLGSIAKKVDQTKRNLERQKALHEAGAKPLKELQKTQGEYDVAAAQLESAKMDAEMLKREWTSQQFRIFEQESRLQIKVDEAQASLDLAEEQLEQTTKELDELKSKAAIAEKVKVLAPADGIISQWPNLSVGQKIENGQVLFHLRVRKSDNKNRADTTEGIEDANRNLSASSDSLPHLISMITELEDRISRSKTTAANAENNLKTTAASIAKLEAQLVSTPASDLFREQLKWQIEQLVSSKSASERQKESTVDDLNKAVADLNLLKKLLQIELDAAKFQLLEINESVEMEKQQYEAGDRTVFELKASKTKQNRIESRVRQLEILLERIKESTNNAGHGSQPKN